MFRGLCCGRELRSWYGGDHASGVIGIWHCHTPTCKQIKNGDFVGAMFFCDVVAHDNCNEDVLHHIALGTTMSSFDDIWEVLTWC